MSVYNFIGSSFFIAVGGLVLTMLLFSNGVVYGGMSSLINSNFFCFDSLSYYLMLLVVFLGFYGITCFWCILSLEVCVFLFLSLLFSVLCFCVNHSVAFWCFYELSMLPLLYLIFRDSPYSERFIAGWYFAVYLLVTSLPLILILLYLSYINGSLYFNNWCGNNVWHDFIYVYVALAFIFFTKVPLMPFHTWLPIVHAEATSIVSIFLSGYIMKLGLLGVLRCAPFLFNNSFFTYLFLCCVFGVFFLVTATKELDGKRWLAFLSLSHIVVPFIGLYVCGWDSISLLFLFCLGHGCSAGLVFGFLWFFYDKTNTRNWLLLKSGISGQSTTFIIVCGMLSLCSFPPTLQFFCEVNLLIDSVSSYVFLAFWSLYLFLGGLVPLVLCGHLLVRDECTESLNYSSYNYVYCCLFLILWCYIGIFMF